MTKQFVLIIAAMYGLLSVLFGAFGAHALKKIVTTTQVASFDVGVRYQLMHGLLLLFLGLYLQFEQPLEQSIAWLIIAGVFLFSFSIYFLALKDVLPFSVQWLGPVTPLGGLLLILGWALLLVKFIKG